MADDHMLDLRPLQAFVNPFYGAADIMAPQAPQSGQQGHQQGQEAIGFLQALGESTPDILTADPVLILVAGRIALNAEQRAVLRLLCDHVDQFITANG